MPESIGSRAKLYVAQAKASASLPGVRFFDGAWSMILSRSPYGLWGFSACLWPRGRGSTLEDWELLGRWAGAVGVPKDCKCLGNTVETQANAVHKWFWPEPGSSTVGPSRDEETREEHSHGKYRVLGTAAALDAAHVSDPTFTKGFDIRTRDVSAGRNDPCPCGSGKKYKRCCLDKPVDFGECQGSDGTPWQPGPRCHAKAVGMYWCKLCPKGAEKSYAYCGQHMGSVRISMQGHCSRVHPAVFPELMKKIAEHPNHLQELRRNAAKSPELWGAQLAEVEKYVVRS